jgi:Tol biopolymer transport system component
VTIPSLSLNGQGKIDLTYLGKELKEIIYIERAQYVPDHHNTETMFQKGEINESSFAGNSSMKAFSLRTGKSRTIIESKDGIVRDPELSFDGKKIIFSMRKNRDDFYHIYEINSDGTGLKQLTFADYVTDIDPLYLPDGSIIFSSTREPKFCMCNRHIMCNLFLMDADGANIVQLGNSTLHEAHSTLMNDGRIMYDRWEYVCLLAGSMHLSSIILEGIRYPLRSLSRGG